MIMMGKSIRQICVKLLIEDASTALDGEFIPFINYLQLLEK